MSAEGFSANSAATLRAALARIARQRPEQPVIVWNYNRRANDDNLPVITVPDGVILRMVIFTGIPFLKHGSGKLIYEAYSSWGNSLEVHGGEAHITTAPGVKVTVRVYGDAVATTDVGGIVAYNRLRCLEPLREVETVDGIPVTFLSNGSEVPA